MVLDMKKRNIALVIAIAIIIAIIPGARGIGTTYTIDPNGNGDYTRLEQVRTLLGPGDTVYVMPGDYTSTAVQFENSGTASNPIKIIGVSDQYGNKPILRGAVNTASSLVQIHANNYIFDNFNVYGNVDVPGNSTATRRGIQIAGDNVIIRRCQVHHCQWGIMSSDEKSGDITIEFSEIYANGQGEGQHNLYMATDEVRNPGSIMTIRFNYIHGSGRGVGFKSRAERNHVYYNVFEDNYNTAMDLLGPDFGSVGTSEEEIAANEGYTVAELRKLDANYGENYVREDSEVVGNLIISNHAGAYARIGGDGGSGSVERAGTTFGRVRFVNNTVIYKNKVFNPIEPYNQLPYNGVRLTHGMGSLEYYNNLIYSLNGGDHALFRPNPFSADNSDAEANNDDKTNLRWQTQNSDGMYYGTNNYFENRSGASVPVGISLNLADTIMGGLPGFVDAASRDFFLAENSPLVAKGTGGTVHTWSGANEALYYSNKGSLVTDRSFPNALVVPQYLPVDITALRALTEQSDLSELMVPRGETGSNVSIGAYPPKSKLANYELESDEYTVDDGFVSGVSEKTAVSGFLSNFSVDGGRTLKLVNSTDTQITNGNVKTGDKIQVLDNLTVEKEYIICVKGDLLGTGLVQLGSAAKLMAAINNNDTLSEAETLAADVDSDGNLDADDVNMIIDYLSGKISQL